MNKPELVIFDMDGVLVNSEGAFRRACSEALEHWGLKPDYEEFRPETMEATAAGAAFLAGLAVGFFAGREEIKEKLEKGRTFSPEMSEIDRYRLVDGWHNAVKAARK